MHIAFLIFQIHLVIAKIQPFIAVCIVANTDCLSWHLPHALILSPVYLMLSPHMHSKKIHPGWVSEHICTHPVWTDESQIVPWAFENARMHQYIQDFRQQEFHPYPAQNHELVLALAILFTFIAFQFIQQVISVHWPLRQWMPGFSFILITCT